MWAPTGAGLSAAHSARTRGNMCVVGKHVGGMRRDGQHRRAGEAYDRHGTDHGPVGPRLLPRGSPQSTAGGGRKGGSCGLRRGIKPLRAPNLATADRVFTSRRRSQSPVRNGECPQFGCRTVWCLGTAPGPLDARPAHPRRRRRSPRPVAVLRAPRGRQLVCSLRCSGKDSCGPVTVCCELCST